MSYPHPAILAFPPEQQIDALLERLRVTERTLAQAENTRRGGSAAADAYRSAFWRVHGELVELGGYVYALPVAHPRAVLVQEFFERLSAKLKSMEFPGPAAE